MAIRVVSISIYIRQPLKLPSIASTGPHALMPVCTVIHHQKQIQIASFNLNHLDHVYRSHFNARLQ